MRLADLVNGLLDIVAHRHGRLNLEYERVDLRALVQRSPPASSRGGARGVRRGGLRHRLHRRCVGRMRLERVLTNLVSNALKYGAGRSAGASRWMTAARAAGARRGHRHQRGGPGAHLPQVRARRVGAELRRPGPGACNHPQLVEAMEASSAWTASWARSDLHRGAAALSVRAGGRGHQAGVLTGCPAAVMTRAAEAGIQGAPCASSHSTSRLPQSRAGVAPRQCSCHRPWGRTGRARRTC